MSWHRTEDERFEGLAQTLRELVETVRTVPVKQSEISSCTFPSCGLTVTFSTLQTQQSFELR
jgi:hypothetical protein